MNKEKKAIIMHTTQSVILDHINLSDETFRISSDNNISDLTASINAIGLINLPLLRKVEDQYIKMTEEQYIKKAEEQYIKKADEKYLQKLQVVCGFRRIHAMKLLGMTTTSAIIISCNYNNNSTLTPPTLTPNTSDSDRKMNLKCALCSIAENAFQRPLTVIEQARGVNLLRKFLSVEDIAADSPSIFNTTMRPAFINMLEDIAKMPLSVHKLIENERLAIGSAIKINSDEETLNAFVNLFSKIKISLNKQKEIITYIHEISVRENIKIVDLLRSDELRAIIDNNDMNDSSKFYNGHHKGKGNDENRKINDENRKINDENHKGNDENRKINDENRKGNIVRSFLFKKRYPNISKAKERFAVNLKLLNLKGDIKLEPPADFEGRDYTFTLKFSSVEELAQKLDILSQVSKNPLISLICSHTGLNMEENMEEKLGRELALRKKTVAVAESCTGGLLGSMLTDVAGSSDYFLLSVVTYSNDAKINILGVNPDTLLTYGAVHEETVKEMAQGVKKIAGADYSIATSGIAGPGGGSDEKPVGTICIGIAGNGFVKAHRYNLSFGNRLMNKKMFAVKAMNMLHRELLNSR